jgi:hypothetical protein
MPDLTEKRIQNDVLREFATRPGLRLWRANTGVAHYGKRTVQFGIPGQADLTGILPVTLFCPTCGVEAGTLGVRLEIECKSPTGDLRSEQLDYMRIIRRFGGIYIAARGVEEVWNAIGGHLR